MNDAFAYNGLGQRVSKTDSTGQFALVSDGASPAAPVLADGLTVYTPGLSSRKNGVSEFRHGDLLGSLRFLTDANQNVVGDRLFSAFGATVYWDGDPSTPFGWVGDGQSQTDADTGLVLMGHRYYDSRTGRFISQDPAGDGDNWYAYADNDPTDETDPTGLYAFFDPGMVGTPFDPSRVDYPGFNSGEPGTWDQYGSDGNGGWKYLSTVMHGDSIWDQMNNSGRSPGTPTAGYRGMGGRVMFAQSAATPQGAEAAEMLAEETGGVSPLGKPGNPAASIEKALQAAKDWLGKEVRAITNKDGDSIFMNKAGTKKLRFDIKNPNPHENPHAHIEELINGKWRGPRVYPRDVPPR